MRWDDDGIVALKTSAICFILFHRPLNLPWHSWRWITTADVHWLPNKYRSLQAVQHSWDNPKCLGIFCTVDTRKVSLLITFHFSAAANVKTWVWHRELFLKKTTKWAPLLVTKAKAKFGPHKGQLSTEQRFKPFFWRSKLTSKHSPSFLLTIRLKKGEVENNNSKQVKNTSICALEFFEFSISQCSQTREDPKLRWMCFEREADKRLNDWYEMGR